MNELVKAVAYVRISSQRQINNESPATQRDAIQKYAEDNGIEIVRWFEDIAKSGKNAERDGLQELLEYSLKHRGKIAHWIVYNMRRASRDIDSYSSQVKIVLRARGITVRSATEPSVTDTKEGRFMESLLVMLGQLDNEGKAEVTIDNMRSLALQGYWQNAPMLGYSPNKIPNELGKLRPSLQPNEMAPKVKLVLERFSNGDITQADLTRFAKEIGLRSRYGNELTQDRIYKLIKHPVYAGYISDSFTNYELVEGKHPAIISAETFEINQTLLHGKNSRKGELHSQVNELYPLRGLILCSNCKNPLYASAPTSSNGIPSPRYHCARKSCKGMVPSVRSDKVHTEFKMLLERIKPLEGILKTYKTILVREANKSLDNLNVQINSLRNQLTRISDTRSETIRKFVDGALSQSEKDELINELEKQKMDKNIKLRKLEGQQSIRESDIEQAINFMIQVNKQWEFSDVDIKQKFQTMIFPEGLIYEPKTGMFGTKNISPLYRCIPNKKASEKASDLHLVALVHSNWNDIWEELSRWKNLTRESKLLANSIL